MSIIVYSFSIPSVHVEIDNKVISIKLGLTDALWHVIVNESILYIKQ